mmetsp:Transcript_17931/g.56221  ORF Transcript_17931/g.56221 Transcript_17931/m.56221 type:complete len:284 (-) Transcript_17931:428-1279(-)
MALLGPDAEAGVGLSQLWTSPVVVPIGWQRAVPAAKGSEVTRERGSLGNEGLDAIEDVVGGVAATPRGAVRPPEDGVEREEAVSLRRSDAVASLGATAQAEQGASQSQSLAVMLVTFWRGLVLRDERLDAVEDVVVRRPQPVLALESAEAGQLGFGEDDAALDVPSQPNERRSNLGSRLVEERRTRQHAVLGGVCLETIENGSTFPRVVRAPRVELAEEGDLSLRQGALVSPDSHESRPQIRPRRPVRDLAVLLHVGLEAIEDLGLGVRREPLEAGIHRAQPV